MSIKYVPTLLCYQVGLFASLLTMIVIKAMKFVEAFAHRQLFIFICNMQLKFLLHFHFA